MPLLFIKPNLVGCWFYIYWKHRTGHRNVRYQNYVRIITTTIFAAIQPKFADEKLYAGNTHNVNKQLSFQMFAHRIRLIAMSWQEQQR